jgi:hypothetical protein
MVCVQQDIIENDGMKSGARIALLVLGAHRSGTSALTRTLSLLGADLPRNLLAPREDNPTGYWESADWVDLHDELLASLNLTWDSPLPLPMDALAPKALAPFCTRLVELLHRDLGTSALFVAKDPRICRLLPLWHLALPKVGFEARHILIVRHPMDVAASLALRNDMPEVTALLLWTRHMIEAEHASRFEPRVFVSYDALLKDWRATVDRIAAALNIHWPIAPREAQAEIESFLKQDLRHHAAGNDRALARYSWSTITYKAAVASVDDEQTASATFDAVRREIMAGDEFFTPMLAELSHSNRMIAQLTDELERLTNTNRSSGNALARHRETIARLQAEATAIWGHVEYRDREIAQLTGELERLTDTNRSSDNELARRREIVTRVQAEAATLWGHVKFRDQEITRLTAEVEALRSVAEAAEARLTEIARIDGELLTRNAEIERLGGELSMRNAEIERLHAERAKLSTQLGKITSSWFWRATHPLRLVKERKL